MRQAMAHRARTLGLTALVLLAVGCGDAVGGDGTDTGDEDAAAGDGGVAPGGIPGAGGPRSPADPDEIADPGGHGEAQVCSPEICDGLDNDCDGMADNDVICGCGEDDHCYGGPPASRGVGLCHDGRRDCDISGEFWQTCTGWVGPQVEICDDGQDNNCDGRIDEGCEPPEPPREARCLRIAPNPLAFGPVRRGENAALSARIESCGQGPVTVHSLERGRLIGIPITDEFQITAQPQWPVTLQPGESVEVEVTYNPGLAGIDFGHFIVRNDSPDPEAELQVTAEGRPPRVEDVSLHVQLEWDADYSDVDLHLIRPGGSLFDCGGDCFYQNPSPDWGVRADQQDNPFLDVDNVRGFGPENINLTDPAPGKYRLAIHYYLDRYTEGPVTGPVPTNATVRIYVRGQLVHEATQHLDGTDRTWEVVDIEWPAGTVTPVDRLSMFDRRQIPECGRRGWDN